MRFLNSSTVNFVSAIIYAFDFCLRVRSRFAAIVWAITSNSFRSDSLARLNRRRNLSNVRASRAVLPQTARTTSECLRKSKTVPRVRSGAGRQRISHNQGRAQPRGKAVSRCYEVLKTTGIHLRLLGILADGLSQWLMVSYVGS